MKEKLQAVAERAVKTFAQSLLAFIIAAGATSVAGVDWKEAASVAALAAVLSLLTSVGSFSFGNPGPSLASEELVPAEDELGNG